MLIDLGGLCISRHLGRNLFAKLTTANPYIVQCKKKERGTVFWVSSEEITVQVMMKHRNGGFWVLRQTEWSVMRAEDHVQQVTGDRGQCHQCHDFFCVKL